MNLFKTLAGLMGAGTNVTIVIQKTESGSLAVSTNFRNPSVTDDARELIAPFVVNGTPDELDAEFVNVVAEPIEKSSGLQTSMQEFEAQQKVARANSKAAKDAKTKADKEKQANEARVKKLTEQGDSLQKSKKYDEAIKVYTEALAIATGTVKSDIQKEIDRCKKQQAPDIFSAFGGDETGEEPSDEALGKMEENRVNDSDEPEDEDEYDDTDDELNPEDF